MTCVIDGQAASRHHWKHPMPPSKSCTCSRRWCFPTGCLVPLPMVHHQACCHLLLPATPVHLAAVGMDDAGVPIWVTSGARYTDLLSVTFAILSGLAVGSLCGMAILKSAQMWRYHSFGAPC